MDSYVRTVLASAMILAILGSGIIFDDAFAGNHEEEQVTICHIPSGNSENPQSLEISPSALQTHLNHGDSQSKCNPNDNAQNIFSD